MHGGEIAGLMADIFRYVILEMIAVCAVGAAAGFLAARAIYRRKPRKRGSGRHAL